MRQPQHRRPNDDDYHPHYARQSRAQWYLAPAGQTREAVKELEALLPLDPLSLDLRHTYIATLYFDRRYADAIEHGYRFYSYGDACLLHRR